MSNELSFINKLTSEEKKVLINSITSFVLDGWYALSPNENSEQASRIRNDISSDLSEFIDSKIGGSDD